MTILYIILLIIFFYSIFLMILKSKIILLEKDIIKYFYLRNNLIPSIYEVTKNKFVKHNDIFNEILKLKKIDFLEKKIWTNIYNIIHTQKLIHNELDFIFKITNKHLKLNKNNKFLYIKDTLIEKSNEIWTKMKLYKIITKKLNFLIFIKNITIIWFLIPIKKIEEL